MKCQVIRVDGAIEELDYHPTRAEVSALIGADTLDSATLWKYGVTMYVDDLGERRGLPVNARATELYLEHCKPGAVRHIYGDVVCKPS